MPAPVMSAGWNPLRAAATWAARRRTESRAAHRVGGKREVMSDSSQMTCTGYTRWAQTVQLASRMETIATKEPLL